MNQSIKAIIIPDNGCCMKCSCKHLFYAIKTFEAIVVIYGKLTIYYYGNWTWDGQHVNSLIIHAKLYVMCKHKYFNML